jgi:hypothetical protein
MGMERRWGVRRPVEVEVLIDNQPACTLQGRVDNISIGGLFVKTEASSLRMNAPVELVLSIDEAGNKHVYRLPAVVVRQANGGVGLMFDQYDVSAFRTLVVLLLDRQKTSNPRRHTAVAGAHNGFLETTLAEAGNTRAASHPGGISGTAA